MSARSRIFKPFQHLVLPVLPGMDASCSLTLAKQLEAEVSLVGLVPVAPEASISAEASTARQLRKHLRTLSAGMLLHNPPRVWVSQTPLKDLQKFLKEDPPDLLLLEWPEFFKGMSFTPADLLSNPICDMAVIRGPWPNENKRTLVPLRGGPFAELALRLGLAVPNKELVALNLISSATQGSVEAPFRGLAGILPYLPEVIYRQEVSDHPVESILAEATHSDLLIMGASGRPAQSGEKGFGPVIDLMLEQIPCSMLVVKTKGPLPDRWTGPDGERTGVQAISLLVDKWFAENTYHADEFDDLNHLCRLKQEQGLTISLALPALNEEKTVGTVIEVAKTALMDSVPLLDEIVLIDSNSSDRTREIGASLGIPVYIHQELLPAYGPRRGKGEALWKSLMVTHGDIVVWIDTDIVNIHPHFVYGVIGPLLANPRLQLVKGFYQRPLKSGDRLQAGGGGRVTELTARPLLNLFYPELSGVIQPLAGEYGGRRQALERLPFFSGYGVEIGLLIEVFEKFGLSAIAQVDLLERIHHNQSLEALSKMSFAILQAVFRKLENRYRRSMLEEVNKTMKLIRFEEGAYFLEVEEVAEQERPPMVELPEYIEFRSALLT